MIIEEHININEANLEKLSYELRQLQHLQLGEDYLLLAEENILENDILSAKSALKKAFQQLISGFKYKQVPLSDRYPKGQIKVRDKLMNPERGLRMLMTSILVKDQKKTNEAAHLIWDSPFADYIGPDGVCSYEEQLLAHAYRDYILDHPDRDGTISDLDSIIINGSTLSTYAKILKSLFLNNHSVATENLETLILIANKSNFDLLALGTIKLLVEKFNTPKSNYETLKLKELIVSE